MGKKSAGNYTCTTLSLSEPIFQTLIIGCKLTVNRDLGYGLEDRIIHRAMSQVIEHHSPLASFVDEARGDESPEAFRNRILRLLKDINDLAGTELNPRFDEEAKGPKASRLSNRFEYFYEAPHLCNNAPMGI